MLSSPTSERVAEREVDMQSARAMQYGEPYSMVLVDASAMLLAVHTRLPRSLRGQFPFEALSSLNCHLQITLDRRLQRRRVRAHDLADFLSILEEQKRRHGAHAQLLRDFGNLVDVDFVEARFGVFVRVPTSSVSD